MLMTHREETLGWRRKSSNQKQPEGKLPPSHTVLLRILDRALLASVGVSFDASRNCAFVAASATVRGVAN